jgi:hypothetical protein
MTSSMNDASAYPDLSHHDSTRLLELYGSFASDGPLRGRLSSVRLSERPKYCALSYAWGEQVCTKRMFLSKTHAVDVSETLFDGLREVMRGGSNEMIWVDQLCIKQADENEKERQVALMAQIYGQAHMVIGWLGIPAADTRLGFRFFEFLAVVKVLSCEGGGRAEAAARLIQIYSSLAQGLCLQDPIDLFKELGNAAREGAAALARRPWFTRYWVVQEVALSPDLRIYCGNRSISGDDLCAALELIDSLKDFPPSSDLRQCFKDALQLLDLRRVTLAGEAQSLLHLAHNFSRWDFSRPTRQSQLTRWRGFQK